MKALHLVGRIDGTEIQTVGVLQTIMRRVARECDFHVVNEAFHQFEPFGATGVLVLAESHFSAHTYPEDSMVYIDVFCCAQEFDPMHCARVLEREFDGVGTWDVVTRR
jgi:S-adenosylmethionine decarboxylase proenzyme